MLTPIKIKRIDDTHVTFETVSINDTDNVFFINLDEDPDPTKSTHWPEICDDKVRTSPPNSSQCIVPPPADLKPPNNKVTYKCKMDGHDNEIGAIHVFAVLASDTVALANAIKGSAIKEQRVVKGGVSPYNISEGRYWITDNNTVIDSGSGVGPGLQLNPDQQNSGGITVTGTPSQSGTYNFTFTVNDGIEANLQQIQYSMKVV